MGAIVMKRIAAAVLILIGASAHGQSRPLVFETVDITGEVQKPEITIFITRQNLDTNYEFTLRESFIPRIIKSVESRPF
jgi:hypothetical protein